MIKYYLINNQILVKGETSKESGGMGLVKNTFAFRHGTWERISVNEINDRIMGFNPYEDSIYGIGNTDTMDSLQEITEDEANRIMQNREVKGD